MFPPKPPPPDVNIMPFEQESGHTIQVIASGPGFPEEMIHQALLTAVYSAREQLIMTTPYFVPSDDLLHAICTAALRGVEVSIIVPRDNDSMMVRWASRAFISLKAGCCTPRACWSMASSAWSARSIWICAACG